MKLTLGCACCSQAHASLHANQVLSEQSEFVELVLSANSPLLGQPISASDCLGNPKTLELLLVLDVLDVLLDG